MVKRHKPEILSRVNLYGHSPGWHRWIEMREDPKGLWVSAEDYEKLRTEREELLAALQALLIEDTYAMSWKKARDLVKRLTREEV